MSLAWQVIQTQWLKRGEREAKEADESEQPKRGGEGPDVDKKASQASGTLVDTCIPVSLYAQQRSSAMVALATQPTAEAYREAT